MVVTTRTETADTDGSGRRYILLTSDWHVGSAEFDRRSLVRELDEAREKQARILINGDVFDAILPGDRKRYTSSALSKEMQGRNDILNAAINLAANLIDPYADLVDVIGVGNHETAVEKIHSLDLVSILVGELHRRGHHHIQHGGYEGYYRLRLQPDRKGTRSGTTLTYTIRRHHGFGGASPATGNIGPLRKTAAWTPDADVVWLGHKHQRQVDASQMRERITASGEVREDPVLLVATGSYLKTRHQQSAADVIENGRRGNYAADSGCPPLQTGGVMLACRWRREGDGRVKDVRAELL